MWEVRYKKRFLKELSKLPNDVRIKAEEIVFKKLLCKNPLKC
jgi:mRNA-degrading endonuclease RelE of RelBE toxin-antitoxin system